MISLETIPPLFYLYFRLTLNHFLFGFTDCLADIWFYQQIVYSPVPILLTINHLISFLQDFVNL